MTQRLPLRRNQSAKYPKASDVWCPQTNHQYNEPGALVNMPVSRLEAALNIERWQCDKCGARYAIKIAEVR
jgi:hypothetical protein